MLHSASTPNVNIKIPTTPSEAPAQLSLLVTKVNFLTLYLHHFPTLYPISELLLPKERVGIACKPSKQGYLVLSN
jgi:hypothetical protein